MPAAEKRSAVFQPTRREATAETAAQTTAQQGNWSDSVPLFVKMRVLVLTVVATTNRESQAEAVNARTEIGQLSADGFAPAASHRCWRSPVRALA